MEQKIALLACGPSLTENYGDTDQYDYDIVIAINGACMLYEADYYCFLDCNVQEELQRLSRVPRIGYRTHLKTGNDLPKEKHKLYGKMKIDMSAHFKAEPDVVNYANNCCNYTFPCTLHFAQELANGGQIDLYGFDCVNELDCAGLTGTRKPVRWHRELPWVKFCWGRNVNVMHSRVNPAIVDWLNNDITWKTMNKEMGWSDIAPMNS